MFLHLSFYIAFFRSLCRYFVNTLISIFVVAIHHMNDSSDWDSENNTSNSPKRSPCKHNNKNEKWRKIERFAHNIRNKNIILELLDDDIEDNNDKCCLPRSSESNNSSRNECNQWSDIWNEFHDSANKCQCEGTSCIKTKNPFYQKKSNVRCNKYTQ